MMMNIRRASYWLILFTAGVGAFGIYDTIQFSTNINPAIKSFAEFNGTKCEMGYVAMMCMSFTL